MVLCNDWIVCKDYMVLSPYDTASLISENYIDEDPGTYTFMEYCLT